MRLLHSQRGFIEYLLLAIVILPVLGLLFLNFHLTPKADSVPECAMPDPNTTVNYSFSNAIGTGPDASVSSQLRTKTNSSPYKDISGLFYRLKQNVAIPKEVQRIHLGKAGTTIDKDKKTRQVYVLLTECDGQPNVDGHNNPCNDTSSWAINLKLSPDDIQAYDLIFVENDRNLTVNPGPTTPFVWVDVYTKNGRTPDFAKKFCDSFSNKNYTSPLLLSDNNQPPLKINIDASNTNLTEFPASPILPPNETLTGKRNDDHIGGDYELVGYAPIGSLLTDKQELKGDLTSSKAIKGTLKIANTTYYLGYVSLARFIVLIDQNSPTLAYYYQPATKDQVKTPAATPLNNLQLKTINPDEIQPFGWWTPECKPAIYLYPEKSTQVSVKVSPKGFLTYTKPQYPASGWVVTAEPNGRITTSGQNYDYLYYESKIADANINKPTQGYVVANDQLENLYFQLLPKLGLNPKETQDFINYWHGLLKAPYYFVGVMDQPSIEQIEPLTISPQPTTNIRVRLYFQPLDQPIAVPEPKISTPTRQGFTMVEWGGMVKNDPNHPFTCSQ